MSGHIYIFHKYLIKLNVPFLEHMKKQTPSLYIRYLYGFVGFHLSVFFVCVLWCLNSHLSFLTLWTVSFIRGGNFLNLYASHWWHFLIDCPSPLGRRTRSSEREGRSCLRPSDMSEPSLGVLPWEPFSYVQRKTVRKLFDSTYTRYQEESNSYSWKVHW